MRDSKGRFTVGSTPSNPRDETTGRFAKKKPTNRHDEVAAEVDKFLKEKEVK